MKTKRFEKKLALNKKTIAHLEPGEQSVVKGGVEMTYSCGGTCVTCVTCPNHNTCLHTGFPVCWWNCKIIPG